MMKWHEQKKLIKYLILQKENKLTELYLQGYVFLLADVLRNL